MIPGRLTRLFLGAGVLAPLIYGATVVLGAAGHPGYSHAEQAVSELLARGAPGQARLIAPFLLYNVLLLVFAAGLAQARSGPRFRIAAAALAAVGVLGLVITLLPMDAPGEALSATGLAHLVLAGILSLGTMASVLAAALGWRGEGATAMARLSIAALAVIAVSGFAAALSAARAAEGLGILQRLTIGAFQLWLLGMALVLLRRPANPPGGS